MALLPLLLLILLLSPIIDTSLSPKWKSSPPAPASNQHFIALSRPYYTRPEDFSIPSYSPPQPGRPFIPTSLLQPPKGPLGFFPPLSHVSPPSSQPRFQYPQSFPYPYDETPRPPPPRSSFADSSTVPPPPATSDYGSAASTQQSYSGPGGSSEERLSTRKPDARETVTPQVDYGSSPSYNTQRNTLSSYPNSGIDRHSAGPPNAKQDRPTDYDSRTQNRVPTNAHRIPVSPSSIIRETASTYSTPAYGGSHHRTTGYDAPKDAGYDNGAFSSSSSSVRYTHPTLRPSEFDGYSTSVDSRAPGDSTPTIVSRPSYDVTTPPKAVTRANAYVPSGSDNGDTAVPGYGIEDRQTTTAADAASTTPVTPIPELAVYSNTRGQHGYGATTRDRTSQLATTAQPASIGFENAINGYRNRGPAPPGASPYGTTGYNSERGSTTERYDASSQGYGGVRTPAYDDSSTEGYGSSVTSTSSGPEPPPIGGIYSVDCIDCASKPSNVSLYSPQRGAATLIIHNNTVAPPSSNPYSYFSTHPPHAESTAYDEPPPPPGSTNETRENGNRIKGIAHILCMDGWIEVNAITVRPFEGTVATVVDGQRKCVHSFAEASTSVSVAFDYRECSVSGTNGAEDRYAVQVVFSFADREEFFVVQCEQQLIEDERRPLPKTFEEALEEFQLIPVKLEQKAPIPTVIWSLTESNETEVDIGTRQIMLFALSPATDAYGLHVKDCVVIDDKNGDTHSVIDRKGCTSDLAAFAHPLYDTRLDTISSQWMAFKLPDHESLHVQCTLSICPSLPSTSTGVSYCASLPSPPLCPRMIPLPGNALTTAQGISKRAVVSSASSSMAQYVSASLPEVFSHSSICFSRIAFLLIPSLSSASALSALVLHLVTRLRNI